MSGPGNPTPTSSRDPIVSTRDPIVAVRGAIVAMNAERIIGVAGNMPWHYREDLQRFKRRTMGCAIIMGRITWDAIGHQALPGRRNIVISRAAVTGVEHYGGVAEAFAACRDEDLWVIGGAQIYRAAMARLNLLDITRVPDVIERDDVVRFPEIDMACWRVAEESVLPGDHAFSNTVYRRITPT